MALVATNPVADTDGVRIPRSLPRPVDRTMLPLILGTADSTTALMCAFAAYAGLRRAEIAALHSDDLNTSTEPGTVVVRHGKGGKDRSVPLHPVLRRMILDARPSGPVFGVGPDAVGIRIAGHLRSLGIDATAHQLRHSFGTELARVSRGNIPLVAGMLGHSELSTTMGYVALGDSGATEIADMFPDAA